MEGATLDQLLARTRESGSWPLEEALAAGIVARLVDALTGRHAADPPVFHRDLSPRHVYLEPLRVELLPFDAARATGRYMSPEQARGRPLDARSDVFTAGLLLFELTCGRLPAQDVAMGELDAPRAVNPKLSDAMTAVLERALKLEPGERFATAAELRAALEPLKPKSLQDLEVWLRPLLAPLETAANLEKLMKEQPAPQPAPAAPRAPKPRAPRYVATGLAVTALFGVVFAVLDFAERRIAASHAEYEQSLRTCEVISEPSGAQIFLDGKPYKERAPTILRLERDRDYTLEVHGAINSVTKRIRNQRKLSVKVQAQPYPVAAILEDELWDASPRPKRAQKLEALEPVTSELGGVEIEDDDDDAPVADIDAPAPARFDTEAAPAKFTLTPEHEVLIPEKLCRQAARGTWRIVRQPSVYGVGYVPSMRAAMNVKNAMRGVPQAQRYGQRDLTLLYMDKKLGRVEVFPERVEAKEPAMLCPFTLTDRSLEVLGGVPAIELGGHHLEQLQGAMVNVPLDARFLVRSLPAGKKWRAHVSPVQPPYAVMVAHRADNKDIVTVIDQSVVDLPEAISVWFTVPVLERQDLKVDVSIEAR
jgi:hypothetical protein